MCVCLSVSVCLRTHLHTHTLKYARLYNANTTCIYGLGAAHLTLDHHLICSFMGNYCMSEALGNFSSQLYFV